MKTNTDQILYTWVSMKTYETFYISPTWKCVSVNFSIHFSIDFDLPKSKGLKTNYISFQILSNFTKYTDNFTIDLYWQRTLLLNHSRGYIFISPKFIEFKWKKILVRKKMATHKRRQHFSPFSPLSVFCHNLSKS